MNKKSWFTLGFCLSSKMLKLEINDILSLFCLARIKYASWYVYDIYRTISYLRTTVFTAENVVILIYQSDKIFLNNLRVICLGINYISVKNIPLWRRDDFNFHIVNFPLIDSNIPAELVYRTYISHLIRYS